MSPAISLPIEGIHRSRFALRAITDSDVIPFVEALRDPAVREGAYHGKLDADEASVRARYELNAKRAREGKAVHLAVWEDRQDSLSGQTLLFAIDWNELTAEVGFWTAPWARGRGVGVAGLELTLRFAFQHLGLERIFGLTGSDNISAQKTMARAGFTREGVLRGLEKTAEGRLDQVCYGVLVGDL